MAPVLFALLLLSGLLLSTQGKPNLVFLLTDDQDVLLNSLDAMPTVQAELIAKGATYSRGYVTTPVCCPSRTSSLTGRFAHNLNDQTQGWCGDFKGRMNDTFVNTLHGAGGYKTGLFGKFYNGYGDFCGANVRVPRGFDRFFAMCDDNLYFGNTFNDQGRMTKANDTEYLTSIIGNETIAWLAGAAANASNGGAPFFAYIAPHAPHVPASVAPWYGAATIPSEIAPRTPNWNVSGADKHWLVAAQPPMSQAMANASDEHHNRRLRSLLSVDDILAAVIETLTAAGVLDNTYIIYTSDHGEGWRGR